MIEALYVPLAIVGVAFITGVLKLLVDVHITKKGLDHVDECIHRIERQLHARISSMEERITRIEDKLDRLIEDLRNSKTNA